MQRKEIEKIYINKIKKLKKYDNAYFDKDTSQPNLKNNIKTIEDVQNNSDILNNKEKAGLEAYIDQDFNEDHYVILYNMYFDYDLFNNNI